MHQLERLRCPHCLGALSAIESSLRCEQNHTFDIARKGYVNFVAAGADPLYTKTLWQARRDVFAAGFFAPLTQRLDQLLSPNALVLDAGCGEGWQLSQLCATRVGIGVDLARDAVAMAAGLDKRCDWLVANLANLPLVDNAVDVVVNLLSPAAYREFERVLKPGGRLLKVMPGTRHLEQLRSLWHKETTRSESVDHFCSRYPSAACEALTYTLPVGTLLPQLCAMTPLGAHQSRPADIDCQEVTFDFVLALATV